MNTHVMQRAITLNPFMQKTPFLQATGAYYRHLDLCIQSGEVALHLIDGKVQIEALEALRALIKFKTGRYGRSTRYGQFAAMADQFEQELRGNKPDLF
jgi:hypothetical protein